MATYRFMPDPQQMHVTGPAPKGREGARELHHTMRECTFFVGGLCELHADGLKPMEGRIALHDRPATAVRALVLSHWRGKQGDSVAKRLDAAMAVRANP